MSDNTKILIRNAREQDIPAVAEIAAEAFSLVGTAEKQETYQRRLTAFPNGFIILVAENEIAAYGCSEKRLSEREPGLGEDPLATVTNLTGEYFGLQQSLSGGNTRRGTIVYYSLTG